MFKINSTQNLKFNEENTMLYIYNNIYIYILLYWY